MMENARRGMAGASKAEQPERHHTANPTNMQRAGAAIEAAP